MYNFKEFIRDCWPFILGVALLFTGIALAADAMGRYTCSNYTEITGKQTRWVTLDECYVKTTNGWQRWDEYKARATASELGGAK